MVKIEDLLRCVPYFSIIHHTKGRVRLRVDAKIEDEAQDLGVDFLNDLPTYIKGIKKIKVNKIIGSITIVYDDSIFRPSLWEELLKGNISDELKDDLSALLDSQGGKDGK